MNPVKSIGLVIATLCIISLAIPFGPANDMFAITPAQNWFQLSADAPNNSTHLQVFEDAINMTYNTNDAF
ncbi:MAG: hypothetical protein KGD60_13410 [Candidatus Thorarchaeota archaeon]|nr:hypothetical protein [Candidatus Thorarchaeota archaeon]